MKYEGVSITVKDINLSKKFYLFPLAGYHCNRNSTG